MDLLTDITPILSFPSPPEVVFRLLSLTSNDNAYFDMVADAVASDPAVCASLIGLSNSAFFSSATRVTTIGQAVRTLGIEQAITAAMGAIFSNTHGVAVAPRKAYRRVWFDCVLRATIARRIAMTLFPHLSGEAYLIGLFQPMGMLAMLANIKGYASLLEDSQGSAAALEGLEMANLGTTNSAILADLAKHWEIPEIILTPLLQFDKPEQKPMDGDIESLCQLSYMLRSATPLQDEQEYVVPEFHNFASRCFDLSVEDLNEIFNEAHQDFATVRAVFGTSLPHDQDGGQVIINLLRVIQESQETCNWLKDTQVLLLSNSKVQQMVMSRMLKSIGVQSIATAKTVDEATRLLAPNTSKIVISTLDSETPEFQKFVRDIENNTELPRVNILVLAAQLESEQSHRPGKRRILVAAHSEHADRLWTSLHTLRQVCASSNRSLSYRRSSKAS